MASMDARAVRATMALVDDTLRPLTERDWQVRAGELQWTVAEVVDHLTDVCAFYALHLAAKSPRRLSVDVRPPSSASNVDRLDTMSGTGTLLALVIDAAPASSRGWHCYGLADPSGFAAMACDELLVHCWDAAVGLGATVRADNDLCRRILARLFPWVSGADAWSTLLWANGRVTLPDKARLAAGWRWHCAPLEEWDGVATSHARPEIQGDRGTCVVASSRGSLSRSEATASQAQS